MGRFKSATESIYVKHSKDEVLVGLSISGWFYGKIGFFHLASKPVVKLNESALNRLIYLRCDLMALFMMKSTINREY